MNKVKVFKDVKVTYFCTCPVCDNELYDNKPLDQFQLCDECDTEFEVVDED